MGFRTSFIPAYSHTSYNVVSNLMAFEEIVLSPNTPWWETIMTKFK